ncbi:hypothetical protein DENSPDRAFT_837769 [Dentipellis sp. KUC8613]|nr:hypothetical protein DENSPDRAFT_837769 [Dentipellis sp. KUC8613]
MQPFIFALVIALAVSASGLPVTHIPRANSEMAQVETARQEAAQISARVQKPSHKRTTISTATAEEISSLGPDVLGGVAAIIKRDTNEDIGKITHFLPHFLDEAPPVKRDIIEDIGNVTNFLPEFLDEVPAVKRGNAEDIGKVVKFLPTILEEAPVVTRDTVEDIGKITKFLPDFL